MSKIEEHETTSDLAILGEQVMEIVNAKSQILCEIQAQDELKSRTREEYQLALSEADEDARVQAAAKIQKLKAKSSGEWVARIDSLISAATALIEGLASAERRQVDKNTADDEQLRAAEKRLQDQRGEAIRLSRYGERAKQVVAELQKVRKQLG